MHIHPELAILGMLSSLALVLWLVIAIPFAIIRLKNIRASEIAMLICALFVVLAIATPDTLFA